jgi:hypothetical protein
MPDKIGSNSKKMSLQTALELAKGYAELGHSGYHELANSFEESLRGDGTISKTVTIRTIAAAMVFSFAIEIYLKALTFQITGAYSEGHLLHELVEKLPNDAREKIAFKYKEQVDQNINLLKLNFYFVVHGDKDQAILAPARCVEHSLDQWPGHMFDEAIELASPLFVKLRYLYEDVADGFTAEVDFRWLIFLLEAIRCQLHENAIARSKSGMLFSFP